MMREQSRRAALCGLLTALAAVILMLGSLIPLATFCGPLLAMVVLLPVLEEYGPKYAWSAWAAASILGLLLAADRELALVFVFFGWYPIVRPRVQRIRSRLVRVTVKLAIACAAMLALYGLLIFVFQLETVTAEFSGASTALVLGMLALGCITFLLADVALGRLTLLWRYRLRRRFFH